jgi:hypothetical protein
MEMVEESLAVASSTKDAAIFSEGLDALRYLVSEVEMMKTCLIKL